MKNRRHMKEYTEADIRRMREYARRRISARVAAQKLGRSPGAVRYKAMMEGIRFRSIERKVA
jgi:hypothetical protein